MLAVLLAAQLAMPLAALAQSARKAESERKAQAKAKPPAAAKTDHAAKDAKPATEPKLDAAPAEAASPQPAASPATEAKPAGPQPAEAKPAEVPAPVASDAPAEPKPAATAEPANPSPNEVVRERSMPDSKPAEPAAAPAETKPPGAAAQPAPSPAGSPPAPAPADAVKQAAPAEQPSPGEQPTAPAATTSNNPPAPAGDDRPASAGTPPTPAPTDQVTEPAAQPATPPAAAVGCNRADFRMAIDVGHTEATYGAVSAHGRHEFDFNRRLAHDLAEKLWSNGFDQADVVVQTDNDLQKRARDLSSRRPNLMLSLHHDSVQDKYLKTAELDGQMRTFTEGFRGYSIFVSRENIYREDSERFARMLGNEMLANGLRPTFHHHEQENRPILDSQSGVFQYDGLVVLKQTTAPAVLLESAVITNPEDEAKADDKAYRNRITNAIIAAVTNFCDAYAARAQPRASPPPAPEKPSARK